MRIRDVIKLTVGSSAVYLVIAACSAYSEDAARAVVPGENADGAASENETGVSPINPVGNALAEGHKSGSRLKLRFYEGTDGSKQFINFFDTELQTTCSAQAGRTADGKIHCVPDGVGSVYYTEAGCVTPALYAVAKANAAPTIAVQQGKSGAATDYYRLGALVAPPGKIYISFREIGETSGCVETAPSATQSYYALGAPLAPGAFVEMTIKNE